MASSDGKQATMYLLVLIVAILSFSFNEPSDARIWHLVQYLTIIIVTIGWAYITMVMNEATQSQKDEQQAKLNEAISLAGSQTGVSQTWWNDVGSLLNKITLAVIVWIVSAVFHSIYFAYPDSIFEYFSVILTNYWHYILDNYSEKQIFIIGVFGSEFLTYWVVGLLYAFLDLTRPSLIAPFKIQQNWVLTFEQFKKAALVSVITVSLLFIVFVILHNNYNANLRIFFFLFCF